MKETWVIVKKDIKETVRTKTFLLSIALVIGLIFISFMLVRSHIEAQLLKTEKRIDPTSYIQPIVGNNIFAVSLIVTMYYSFIINNYTLLIEKTKRSLESLLCTPIDLKSFLLGKTLSMFIPSVLLGFLFTIAAFCAVNIFIVSPEV
jgi:ABC-type Na+ efflux pump permease subunit